MLPRPLLTVWAPHPVLVLTLISQVGSREAVGIGSPPGGGWGGRRCRLCRWGGGACTWRPPCGCGVRFLQQAVTLHPLEGSRDCLQRGP